MAIELGTETLAVTSEERTWRIQIETVDGQAPWVKAHREVVRRAGSEVLSRDQNAAEISRTFDENMTDKVTVGDKTITAHEMAVAIAAFIDLWRQQDIA